MIEGHGDDIHRYEAGMVRMNFSTNIYQQADHSALKAHLAERMDVINNYPEPEPLSLERMIAERLGINADCVMVTNGATEAIYLIAQKLHRSVSIIPQPTFSEYADACRINNHIVTQPDRQRDDEGHHRIYGATLTTIYVCGGSVV